MFGFISTFFTFPVIAPCQGNSGVPRPHAEYSFRLWGKCNLINSLFPPLLNLDLF